MGISSALLLFFSVLLHELSHSIVAKAKKIDVKSITLFFFGGVAGIEKEDIKASSEFLMAIAGPLFSIFLGFIFLLSNLHSINPIWSAISKYLYQINFILAGFNLLPGYPLDGGRAFRAILYGIFKDLKKATRIAAGGGKLVAAFLIVLGIMTFSHGGLWFLLIGGFLYFIAGASYEQVMISSVLKKIPITKVMRKTLPKIAATKPISYAINQVGIGSGEYFLVKTKTFTGILSVNNLSYPGTGSVIKSAVPLGLLPGVKKNSTANDAYHLMATKNLGIVPVFDKRKLAGFVVRSDLLSYLSLNLRFENTNNKNKH